MEKFVYFFIPTSAHTGGDPHSMPTTDLWGLEPSNVRLQGRPISTESSSWLHCSVEFFLQFSCQQFLISNQILKAITQQNWNPKLVDLESYFQIIFYPVGLYIVTMPFGTWRIRYQKPSTLISIFAKMATMPKVSVSQFTCYRMLGRNFNKSNKVDTFG